MSGEGILNVPAHTRYVKVGNPCLPQTKVIRGYPSGSRFHTYTGAIETAQNSFGKRIYL